MPEMISFIPQRTRIQEIGRILGMLIQVYLRLRMRIRGWLSCKASKFLDSLINPSFRESNSRGLERHKREDLPRWQDDFI